MTWSRRLDSYASVTRVWSLRIESWGVALVVSSLGLVGL